MSDSAGSISPKKIYSGLYLRAAELIEKDDVPRLRVFLDNHPKLNLDQAGNGDVTLLYWSIIKEAKRSMQVLLTYGADPNVPVANNKGPRESLLALTVGNDDPYYYQTLLKAGADPDGTYRTSPATVRALRTEHFDRIPVLLDAGADINTVDGQTSNPLVMVAAALGEYEHVKYLLRRGADYSFINVRGADLAFRLTLDKDRYKPSIERQRQECQDFLEQKGYTFPAVHPSKR